MMSSVGVLRSRLRATVTIRKIVAGGRALVMGAALVSSAACFVYTEVPATEPIADARAEFRLSDEGRLLMRNALGPGVLTVEGRIVSNDDSAWTVKVYRLTTLRGEPMNWTGEEVQIPHQAVSLVMRRDVDKGRSLVAAAGVTGAVVLFVVSRGLFGGGTQMEPGDCGCTGTSFRHP